MSLKDEIEKIIQAEQKKIESRDQKDREYRERQRDRFRPLHTLLNELVASIDPAYIRASIDEDRATIEVGRKRGDSEYFETDERWRINPNYDVQFHAAKGEGLFKEKPGFSVEETSYIREPEHDTFEKTHRFDTEEQVMSCLVGKIAERVAHYRHLSAMIEQMKKDNGKN